jgi:adenine-specific DNA-methyltransferase
MVVFRSVELLSHSYLHAEGFYTNGVGEKKAYFHIGPKFGTVSKTAVNEAVKECRSRGDAGWLIILGFSFESDIEGSTQTMSMGKFEVTKVRIHDDLLQEGLKKKPAKSAASFVTIGEPDIDLVDSGQWIVDSNKKILCNYDIFKRLSGLDSLAKINGLSKADLSAYLIISQRRDIWLNFSNAKGSSEHSGKHSRRTGEEHNGRVSSILGDSERFFSGIADFDSFIGELGLSDSGKLKTFVDELRRSRKDAEWIAEISYSKELTTIHYSLTTIKGLDIYDPIKDEVKPRNVHDIAYWMVDDDYDGSNFVVKQVFFCGGEKSEFDKWKKGLDNLAKDSTKKKVEKTLKIEIDDEAFDRLYGHISHPIEIKKKGQKIAVRIISQFGEECTKVLTA